MESLHNKNVLVVGATGGIGQAVVKLLAGSGARLFLTSRDAGRLAELAQSYQLPSTQTAVLDLQDPAQISHVAAKYFEAFPTIDILINAAGIGIIKPVENLSLTDFQQTIQVNLVAPFLLCQAFLPAMKTVKKGLIIHIPGVLGKVPMAGAAAYSASKYGLTGMMQSIREELKRTDIRITNLFLGGVDSPFWDTIDLRVQRDKMIRADEAAKAIWFLCQQPSSGVVSEMVLQPFNHQAI